MLLASLKLAIAFRAQDCTTLILIIINGNRSSIFVDIPDVELLQVTQLLLLLMLSFLFFLIEQTIVRRGFGVEDVLGRCVLIVHDGVEVEQVLPRSLVCLR